MDKRSVIKLAALFLVLLFSFSGCEFSGKEKKQEVEYEVCYDAMLPDELYKILISKKEKPFKLSFVNGENLYIAVGYGEHDRNNLCIKVNELYRTSSAIYMDTTLVTNTKEEVEYGTQTDSDTEKNYGESSMYPYIVIRCEKQDLPVIFVGQ